MRRLIRGSVLLCGALMMVTIAQAQQMFQVSSIDVAATYDLERAKIASSNCGSSGSSARQPASSAPASIVGARDSLSHRASQWQAHAS